MLVYCLFLVFFGWTGNISWGEFIFSSKISNGHETKTCFLLVGWPEAITMIYVSTIQRCWTFTARCQEILLVVNFYLLPAPYVKVFLAQNGHKHHPWHEQYQCKTAFHETHMHSPWTHRPRYNREMRWETRMLLKLGEEWEEATQWDGPLEWEIPGKDGI